MGGKLIFFTGAFSVNVHAVHVLVVMSVRNGVFLLNALSSAVDFCRCH